MFLCGSRTESAAVGEERGLCLCSPPVVFLLQEHLVHQERNRQGVTERRGGEGGAVPSPRISGSYTQQTHNIGRCWGRRGGRVTII